MTGFSHGRPRGTVKKCQSQFVTSWKEMESPTIVPSLSTAESGTFTLDSARKTDIIPTISGGKNDSGMLDSKHPPLTSSITTTCSDSSGDTWLKMAQRVFSGGKDSPKRSCGRERSVTHEDYENSELAASWNDSMLCQGTNLTSQLDIKCTSSSVDGTKPFLHLLKTDSHSPAVEKDSNDCMKIWHKGKRACGHKTEAKCTNSCNDHSWLYTDGKWVHYYVK